MCILVGAVGFVARADNATRLSGRVRREVSRLGVEGTDLERLVPYRPVRDNRRPCWLVFLPGWRVSVADLSAAGLDEDLAERIFRELGYVGFGDADGPDLVVAQDGRRLHFTSTGWTTRADRVLVARGQGPCGIVLRRQAAAWKIVALRW
jgi:hypothetical protein